MANKLRMDLELDSKGYVAGAQEASRSTKDLKQQTEDFISDFGSLRKQLASSKKEVQNLAGAYASLSKTEKQSEFGKEMKAQLDIAIEKAAELQDVMGDAAQAIKNASSDTQTWDALKEGMEIAKSATLAYAGAVAKLTGNEEDLAKLVKTLTMLENGFNTVIKVGNALQQQSAIMTSVRKVQLLAAAKAEEMAAAATGKATIAQKAFNAVAKANPYVLLATAAIAAATAIGGYMLATSKASKEDERAAKAKQELHEASIQGQKDAQKEIVSLDLLYKTATDTNKSMKDRLDAVKQIRTEYPAYFGDLSNEAILTGEAADAYKELKNDIIAAAKARAYQNKIEKLAEEEIDLDDQIAKQKAVAEAARRRAEEMKKASMNSGTNGVAQVNLGAWGASSAASDAKAEEKALKDLQKQKEGNIAQQEKYRQEYDKTSDSVKNLANNEKEREKNKGRTGSGSGHSNIEKTKTELQKLQAEVTSWQQALENVDIEAPDAQQTIAYIKENLDKAQKAVKDYKITVGLEVEKPKSTLDKLKDELKQAEAELPFAISEEDVERIQAKIKEIKDKIEKEEIRLKIKPEVDLSKAKEDIDKITRKLNAPKEQKYDFSFLPDNFRDQADDALDRLNELKNARNEYNNIIESNSKKAIEGDKLAIEYISQAKTALSATDAEYIKLTNDLQKFNDVSSQIKERTVEIENFKNSISSISTVVGSIDSVVSSFNNLTSAFEEDKNGWEQLMAVISFVVTVLNTVATVMEVVNTIQDIFNVKKALGNKELMQEAAANTANATAITAATAATTAETAVSTAAIAPTILLAKAMAKLAAANIFAAHSYIPFVGPPMATAFVGMMEAVLATVGAFAHGGIVEGNSYSGDKIIARVNSGEMILNKQQQSRLFNLLNGNITPQNQNQNLTFGTVKVQGSDLILAIKNELKVTGQKTLF